MGWFWAESCWRGHHRACLGSVASAAVPHQRTLATPAVAGCLCRSSSLTPQIQPFGLMRCLVSARRDPPRSGGAPVATASALHTRAVDQPGLPSGLDSDSGAPLGTAVAVASDTLTVAFIKQGLVQDAALNLAGTVHRIDPGVPPKLMASLISPPVLQVGAQDLKTLPVPAESSTAMKYERGRLLLIAGSDCFRGAAHLAVRGALASGAGSVRAALPKWWINSSGNGPRK